MKLSRRNARFLAAAVWLSLLVAGYTWGHGHGYGAVDMARSTYQFMAGNPVAPLIYIAIYVLRAVVFFPALWLTVLGGSLFGFWYGVLYTVIAENLSASFAYLLGRAFGVGSADGESKSLLVGWRAMLEEQAFTAVLIMRVVYMPFDAVNYLCGLLGVPWTPYAIATFIGVIPSLVTFVSFGASMDFGAFLGNLDHFSAADLFDARQVAVSGSLFVLSLLIAVIVHRRHRQRSQFKTDV